jgi:hypothetical protein
MSLYDVQHAIHTISWDPALSARFHEAPVEALADFPLDDAERQALADGDVVALWQMGVHPLMMLHYARMKRLPAPDMYKAIGPLAGQRKLSSVLNRAS